MTGEEYRKEIIRDVFIYGIISHSIRQRLLENVEPLLVQAFETAQNLDSAQKSSVVYATNGVNKSGLTVCARKQTENSHLFNEIQSKLSLENRISAAVSKVSKLFTDFCRIAYHNRTLSPAKSATCHKCNKGHFFKI